MRLGASMTFSAHTNVLLSRAGARDGDVGVKTADGVELLIRA